jgi:hypothetical protein
MITASRAQKWWLGLIGLAFFLAAGWWYWSGLITVPKFVAGRSAVPRRSDERVLTQAEVSMVTDWLRNHRSGWGSLVYTPPLGDSVILLDTEDRKSQTSIQFWLPKTNTDAKGTVMVRQAGGNIRVQGFSATDLTPLAATTEIKP